MTSATVKVEGIEEMNKLLKRLPSRMRAKYLRTGIRRGITLIRDEIKATAPIRDGSATSYRKGQKRPPPGRLRRLVRIKARRAKRSYLKVSLYYPTEGRGNDPKNAFYWRFLEFGTRNMAAQPYIRPAVASKFQTVVNTVIQETNAGLKAEIAKVKK